MVFYFLFLNRFKHKIIKVYYNDYSYLTPLSMVGPTLTSEDLFVWELYTFLSNQND